MNFKLFLADFLKIPPMHHLTPPYRCVPLADDQRHGLGVFFFADGGRYEGGWEANRRGGQGVMTCANGEV